MLIGVQTYIVDGKILPVGHVIINRETGLHRSAVDVLEPDLDSDPALSLSDPERETVLAELLAAQSGREIWTEE